MPNLSRLGPRKGCMPAKPTKLMCLLCQRMEARLVHGRIEYIVQHDHVSYGVLRVKGASGIGYWERGISERASSYESHGPHTQQIFDAQQGEHSNWEGNLIDVVALIKAERESDRILSKLATQPISTHCGLPSIKTTSVAFLPMRPNVSVPVWPGTDQGRPTMSAPQRDGCNRPQRSVAGAIHYHSLTCCPWEMRNILIAYVLPLHGVKTVAEAAQTRAAYDSDLGLAQIGVYLELNISYGLHGHLVDVTRARGSRRGGRWCWCWRVFVHVSGPFRSSLADHYRAIASIVS